MEMKMTLSMPSTSSSAVNVTIATNASGASSQSSIVVSCAVFQRAHHA
jgi:hypothetical protein